MCSSGMVVPEVGMWSEASRVSRPHPGLSVGIRRWQALLAMQGMAVLRLLMELRDLQQLRSDRGAQAWLARRSHIKPGT